MIALLAALALAAGDAPAARTEICKAMVGVDPDFQLADLPAGFRLLDGPEVVTLPDLGKPVMAIDCGRDQIVPEVRDIRVLVQLHIPLFITQGGRVLALEISERRVRGRMVAGELTAEEQALLTARLAEMPAYRRP